MKVYQTFFGPQCYETKQSVTGRKVENWQYVETKHFSTMGQNRYQGEIKIYSKGNESLSTTKAVLCRAFIVIKSYIKKKGRSAKNKPILHSKKKNKLSMKLPERRK